MSMGAITVAAWLLLYPFLNAHWLMIDLFIFIAPTEESPTKAGPPTATAPMSG